MKNKTKQNKKPKQKNPKEKRKPKKGKKEKTFCHRLFLNPIINLSNNKFQSCMNAAMFFHIDFPEFIARWGHMQISKVKLAQRSVGEPNMMWGQKDIRNNDGTMKLFFFLRRHRDMLGKRWANGHGDV